MVSPELTSHSIVVVGQFNPIVYQPLWFAGEEILRQSEATAASVEFINNDFVKFNTDWLSIFVSRERFTASTAHESSFEVLRDLVRATFETHISTPIQFAGLNTEYHFRLRKGTTWNSIAEKYAPSKNFPEGLSDRVLTNISFEVLRDSFEITGKISVRLEPSVRIENGLYVFINDHFEFAKTPSGSYNGEHLVSLLENGWEKSQKKAASICKSLMDAIYE
ncbi:MAG: hypothetical protein WCG80_06765 [Spirochaetales bacterium]